MGIEALKKTERPTKPKKKIYKLGESCKLKFSNANRTKDASFTKRIQDMEEIISGIEENTEEMGTSHIVKIKMFLTQNI